MQVVRRDDQVRPPVVHLSQQYLADTIILLVDLDDLVRTQHTFDLFP